MKKTLLKELELDNLHKRHPGLSFGLSLSYAEAARVCFDRHHVSPIELKIEDDGNESKLNCNWVKPGRKLKNAYANEIDTTEFGAYGVVIATIEVTRGMIAVRRAETKTGADYYLSANGDQSPDFENCIRLEVSGLNNGSHQTVRSRLKEKLSQANDGNSDLPAIAGVVGFETKVVLIQSLQ